MPSKAAAAPPSWLAPGLVFGLALAVYLLTAPPGLTWAHDSADGGDLISAALTLGVPHPSGYPTWTLLAALFSRLPLGTAAWRVTLLSMLSAATAGALVAATTPRLARLAGLPQPALGADHKRTADLPRSGRSPTEPVLFDDDSAQRARTSDHKRTADLPRSGRSPTEPVLFDDDSAQRARTSDHKRTAGETSARGWSPVVLLLSTAPSLAAGLTLAFSPLLWGQATVAEVYALHAALAAGALWASVRGHAGGGRRWAAAAGLFLGLGLGNHLTTAWLLPAAAILLWTGAARRRERMRTLAAGGAGLAAGLLVYLYLPWAASGDSPINWAAPGSMDRLWWLVSGVLYRGYAFAAPWTAAPGRLAVWSAELWRSFWPWGLAVSLLGLVTLWQRQVALAAALSSSLLLGLVWAIGYNTSDSQWTLLPGWVILALTLGVGLAMLLDWLAGWRRNAALLAALLSIALAAAPAAIHWQQQTLRHDQVAEQFYSQVLQQVAENAVVLTAGDRATFALWYGRYGLALRPDVTPVSRELWALPGYRAVVARQHPELAGPQPPAAWPDLLQAAGQRRPLYLAQASGEGNTLPPAVDNWSATPELQGAGWSLWRLTP